MTFRDGRASRRFGSIAALSVLVLAHAHCGDDKKDLFVRPFDAGADVEDEARARDPSIDPTLGGPCSEDAQCNDDVPCTFDRCDLTLSRCRNTPDDTLCADGVYCNGVEKCVLRKGCVAGPVVTCQDDNLCTIDRCLEATKSCEHAPRDLDRDGDPDDHCTAKRDCDDTDPTVSSQLAEICGNFKDDNCNGVIDEQPCASPANDVCGTALAVSAPGTYLLTSVAAKKDYTTTCTVAAPNAARDMVVAITVPAGQGAKNVEVWTTAAVGSNELAIALQSICGDAGTELACGHIAGVANARAIARGVAAGATVYAVITAQAEGSLDLKVDFRPAAPKPANEACGMEEPVALETPTTVRLIDPDKDLPSGCSTAQTGELLYSFSLPEPRDVRIFASTLVGSGQPVVTLRDATCIGELRCRLGATPPLFARSLPAGTHVFGVAATTQLDASVLVKTYPPTTAPPNQSCATAPPIAIDGTVAVDLGNQEDAIENGCFPGVPSAAYALELAVPSDVLVIGRFPFNELGAVSINTPACQTTDVLVCLRNSSPARVRKRNLPAGSYRIVISDELGQNVALSVLARPTVPPVSAQSSDGCVSPLVIPETGGFFTGDTSTATADFGAGCDAPGQSLTGAKDQLLRLDLTERKRVVFDMADSFETTILDVRQGPSCPGVEVPGACHVGFTAGRSFLDRTFDPGTYWVQIDGYSGTSGPWNLDVRVLPP